MIDQKQSMKKAGYQHIRTLSPGVHILKDLQSEKLEVWCANKHHAGYGIIYGNTHLEFAREYKEL